MSESTEVSTEVIETAGAMDGREGLAVFCQELDELGLRELSKDVWLRLACQSGDRRKHVEASIHATFSLLGGVPGLAAWAYQNKNLFYTQYMKLAPTESVLTGAGNFSFTTPVGETVLDHVGVDRDGKVFNTQDDIDDIPE